MTARGNLKKDDEKSGAPGEATPARRVSNIKPAPGGATKLVKPITTSAATTIKANPLANIPDDVEKIPEDL